MNANYHFWGIISSVLFCFTACGLYGQLKKIHARKTLAGVQKLIGETPCSSISSNRIFGSYAAFFGSFLLGMSMPYFNWYLIGTRSVALILLLFTLWEIQHERKDFWSALWLFNAMILLPSATSVILFMPHLLPGLLPVAKIWIVIALIFLLQGYVHQIYVLKRTKLIGGVSKFMFQMFLIKELSTIAFALTMDFRDSWPLLLQHTSLLIFEITILVEIHRIESEARKIKMAEKTHGASLNGPVEFDELLMDDMNGEKYTGVCE